MILEKFDLKLKKKNELMLALATVFEKGISHIGIGSKKIVILKSPEMQIEPLMSEDSWAPAIRLHSSTKPAYKTDDTKPLYYLHGVYLPPYIWKKTTAKKITVEEIMAIKNIEQRRVVIQHIGAEIFSNHKTAIEGEVSEHGNQLVRLVGLLNKKNTPELNSPAVSQSVVLVNTQFAAPLPTVVTL